MEKFSQYRDRGTGIAPFVPIPSPFNAIQIPIAATLLVLRLPIFATLSFGYFLVLQFLPISALVKKGILWTLMLVAGVWWIDLQVEGVKRGTLSKHPRKLPAAGSIVVSTFSSPLDALYLAAMFDPIFVLPVPSTNQIKRISLPGAILKALSAPALATSSSGSTTLSQLLAQNPHRIIVIFPEGTTTNGRALLSFQNCLPSTLASPIFPVSLRYTPTSVVTPIPHTYFSFLWRLLGQPTHAIKVRIGEAIVAAPKGELGTSSSTETITVDSMERDKEKEKKEVGGNANGELEDRVGEALARIGRIRRVGLGLKEKVSFWAAWNGQKKKM